MPEAMTSRARAHEPAGSTPEIADDFSLLMSRAARRCTRATVALASDLAVAGMVLLRRSEKGGSFAKESRLALASALSSLQAVTASAAPGGTVRCASGLEGSNKRLMQLRMTVPLTPCVVYSGHNLEQAEFLHLCVDKERLFMVKNAEEGSRLPATSPAPNPASMMRGAAPHTAYHLDWTLQRDAEKAWLLACLNAVCTSGQLPDSWLTAIVMPILNARKPATAPPSYGPGAELLIGAGYWFPEPPLHSCFHRRCRVDTGADQERGRDSSAGSSDLQSACDGLPYLVVMHALDALGVFGCMGHFEMQSSLHLVTADVPQACVLSIFLINVALARLHASWTNGARRILAAVRTCIQEALNASVGHLASVGLQDQGPPGAPPPSHPRERCLSQHSTDLLFPARSPSTVFKVVLCYLADSMQADRL
ncbi:hypothetical protein HPB49_019264 [Dermacentor silvarum]|uniref:Uncharacterized protein n=1 Tax=Dermacentor silvarum TaxID=543639 RepID=A0ACB8CZR1_DERSI|nr:hypothetical protein HPB49_019264 [Dermacentor silvarum]